MNTTETTGSEIIRQTLAVRRKGGHVGWIARDCSTSVADLDNFIDGSVKLKTEVLQKLTTLLFHGHALYDERLDRLRKTKQEDPKPLCPVDYPPKINPQSLPKFTAGPAPSYRPEGKVVAKSPLQPGWAE